MRVTDASGSSFDYLGATRKEDLFYYDGSSPDSCDQIFDFEYQLDTSSMISDVSVYTMEVRDPYGVDNYFKQMIATTLIVLIL